MSAPKVSILIPAYNAGKFLDETIQSVLSQTFGDFELIISDNHSTDNSDEIIKKYLSDTRVTYHRNDSNIGLIPNWNKSLTYARGEYIKLLCADDILHPQMLEKFVPILDNYPTVSLVTCFKEEFGLQSILWEIPLTHLQDGKKMITETLKNYNYIGETSTTLFRKSGLSVGNFGKYWWIADWEYWVRLLLIGDCYVVPERLCFTRNHDTQVTKQVWKNLINHFEEYELVANIRDGQYNADFSDHLNLEDLAKQRAIDCLRRSVHELTKGIHKKQNRTIFVRGLKIAKREKLLPQTFSIIKKKLLRSKQNA